MFQQSRLMHSMEPMEFLSHRMSPHGGTSVGQNLDLSAGQSVSNKRQRVDGGGSGGHSAVASSGSSGGGGVYDHSAVNFFPMDTPSLVVSKAEYEVVKQEVNGVKRALGELRSSINSEIDQLKTENRQLKTQVAACHCRHRHGVGGGTSGGGKATQTSARSRASQSKSSDKTFDDDGESPSLQAYVDVLERENKSFQQRINELEKQLHRVRAAVSSRVPPIPSTQAMSFFRELVAYYTLVESTVDAGGANASSGCNGDGGVTPIDGGSSAGVDAQKFIGGGVGGGVFDSPMFASSVPSSCSLFGLGMMPEAFDVEKGLQVQLLPNYNVWVSKSKLQFILKESATLKDGGAPLFVLRRLIPLVFTWDELAASRGQGLNCKSTDDVLTKDPLDPMKVLVSKAYMRKFCLESGQPEPSEKSINETFSHQVNYARRKFKRGKVPEISVTVSGINTSSNGGGHNDNEDAYSQTHCRDNA